MKRVPGSLQRCNDGQKDTNDVTGCTDNGSSSACENTDARWSDTRFRICNCGIRDDIPAVQNGATVILDERTVAIEELPPGTEEQVGCETEDGPEAGDAVDDDEALVGVVTVGVVIAVAAIDGLLLVPIEDTHEHTALADDWT